MALPNLNSVPKYDLVIPSTQQKIKFRPFLVKEQKVLLIAYESQDKAMIINAIIDTIDSCIEDITVGELTTYDIDYVFSQIRAKSVGEKVELYIKCSECEADNPVAIDLEKINVEHTDREKEVSITDDISVRMRYPSYEQLLRHDVLNPDNSVSQILMGTIRAAMYSVITKDENILLKDEPMEEIEKFVDSMTANQFEEISNFIQQIPTVKYHVEFKCKECGTVNKPTLEGLEDFF